MRQDHNIETSRHTTISEKQLFDYAQIVQKTLNEWSEPNFYHSVAIKYSSELVECVIAITNTPNFVCVSDVQPSGISRDWLEEETGGKMTDKINMISKRHGRVFAFENLSSFIYKMPCVACWSKEQAEKDAVDLIGVVLLSKKSA